MANTHTSNNDEEKIMKENIQKGFKNMFSGKNQPLSNMSIQEVEALKARVTELEAGLAGQPSPVVSPHSPMEMDRKPSLVNARPPQKRQRPRLGVAIKSLFIIALVFVLAAVLQYQFNFKVAKNEIEQAARQHSEANYETYASRVRVEQNAAEALAASIAQRADVRELYQTGDRKALYELLLPMFNELKESNRVVHLYLEDTHGKVFLRVHDPENFGDDVTYRETTADALREKRVTSGIELGINRIGVRGVAPMYAGKTLIGLIEVGFDFDEQFVNDLKELSGADYSMWVTRDAAEPAGMKTREDTFTSPLETMFYYTGTITSQWNIAPEVYEKVLATGEPAFEVITKNTNSPAIVYIVPLRGYKDKIIGIFEIADSYRNTLSALKNTQLQILEIVIALTVLGLALIAFFYQRVVLRPLSTLANFAQHQLSGDTNQRVSINSHDEFEQLATLFNTFADSVNERRLTLEQRVRDRTHDLELASEVGRIVAEKVTDLSQMLTEAAELIRTRFNL
jgi:methyl-accepting chemotaxis protein